MLSVKEVLNEVGAHLHESHLTRLVIGHVNLCIGSRRLRTFLQHGTRCEACGIEGVGFDIEPHTLPGASNVTHHSLQLYAFRAGERIRMTRDHIQARALGGLDSMANSQTLCEPCNTKKGEREAEVLAYLRRLCGLSEWGSTPSGQYPPLTRALLRVHLDLAWEKACTRWDWKDPTPVEDQLRAHLEGPLLSPETATLWQKRLADVASRHNLSTVACHRWLDRQGRKMALDAGMQASRRAAACLDLCPGGFALLGIEWARWEAIGEEQKADARKAAEDRERAAEAEARMQGWAHELNRQTRRIQKIVARHERRICQQEPVVTPALSTLPERDRLQVATLTEDMGHLAEFLAVDLATYREGCEMRGINEVGMVNPVHAALLGLSPGGFAAFLGDRGACLSPGPGAGIPLFLARWAARFDPAPPRRGKLGRHLTRFEDMARLRTLTPDAYRALCEERGKEVRLDDIQARQRATAAFLGLTLTGLVVFNDDYGTWLAFSRASGNFPDRKKKSLPCLTPLSGM